MLILTRKCGETLLIGDNIELTVTEIAGDKVKLAINAPRSITVLRGELREIKRENTEASKIGIGDIKKFLSEGGGSK